MVTQARAEQRRERQELPVVSVVVVASERAAALAPGLEALCEQELGGRPYEVLVVDPSGRAETRELVEDLQRRLAQEPRRAEMIYLADGGNVAAARNRGWRAARGDVVAFLDAGCIPTTTWLEEGLEAFADEHTAAAAGRLLIPLPAVPSFQQVAARHDDERAVAGNCFCRRSALERVGGFDERIAAEGPAVRDLLWSVEENVGRVAQAPEAVALRPVDELPWYEPLRDSVAAEFEPLLQQKHGELYRESRTREPWSEHVAAGAALVTVGAFLFGRRRTAGVAAGLWAALTLRDTAHRLSGAARSPRQVLAAFALSALLPAQTLFHRVRGALVFRASSR